MTVPDLDTVRRAQKGDISAQRFVLEFLYPSVRKHLGFLFGFRPEVEDWTHDAMIEILRALPSFRHRSSLMTWAHRIASRTASKKLTPLPTAATHELPESVYEVDFVARVEIQRLAWCLLNLKPKKREAFVLLEVLEMTAQEAAAVLGTFANTVASRCRHARAELEQMMRGGEPRSSAARVLTNLSAARH
ncbi:MAG: RNA polymerase sigma factor [Myxococcales bacterium]|nr:RNA polymerase sigma factor [Myxococcales bacterium]